MRAGREPAVLHDRLAGGRGRDDDGGVAQGFLGGRRGGRVNAVALRRGGRELLCGLGAARVDAHALERQDAGHGLDVRGGLHAGAQHRERGCALARKGARRDRAHGCGADRRHGGRVDDPVTWPSSPLKTTTTP